MAFGHNLRKVRGEQQRTQADIAQAAGVNQGFISQLENGEKSPSIEVAIRIANFLNVSLDDLTRSEPSVAETEPAQ